MMFAEPAVFGGYHGMLEIGRDPVHGNKIVPLLVGSVLPQRANAPLHLDGGGWRIDPAETQHAHRPKRTERKSQQQAANYDLAQPLRLFPSGGPDTRFAFLSGHVSSACSLL